MFVRGYLRASTSEQDANRAKDQLKAFAAERGLNVAAWYAENESGTKLARPELFRLLADSQPGDMLLVEQVDRLSRLTAADWERLKADLTARRVRVVALDLPTSWTMAPRPACRRYLRCGQCLLDAPCIYLPPWPSPGLVPADADDRRNLSGQQRRACRATCR